jgi:hypothetical protein
MEKLNLSIFNFKKFVIFTILVLLILSLVAIVISPLFEKYVILESRTSGAYKINRILEEEHKNEIPILGSSRAHGNYVPSILGENYFNYGIDGTSAVVWLFFLKHELKKDKQTSIIINLDGFSTAIGDISNYILNYNQAKVLLTKKQRSFTYTIPLIKYFGEFEYFFKTYFNEKLNVTKITDNGGSFEKNSLTPERFKALVEQREKQINEFSMKETLIEEFYDLIRNTSRKIIIVIPPNHSSYYKRFKNLDELEEILDDLSKFDNVRILDYKKLEIIDEHFKDTTHLNYEGAKLFSSLLAKELAEL